MILIVDIKGLAFRTAWGTNKRVVGEMDMTPTYGFLRSLTAVYRRLMHVNQIIFCCDPPSPTYPHRRAIFPGYKQKKAPGKPGGKAYEDKALARVKLVHDNLPYIKYAASLMNCLWFEDSDFEADDLVAWTVGHTDPSRLRVILSNDRDFFPLIGPNVEVLSPARRARRRSRRNRGNWRGGCGSADTTRSAQPGAVDLGAPRPCRGRRPARGRGWASG